MAQDDQPRSASSGRAQRFARLRPRTGDLFEHFGVALEPTAQPVRAEPANPAQRGDAPVELVVHAGSACPSCGWYEAVPRTDPCWLCGAPP